MNATKVRIPALAEVSPAYRKAREQAAKASKMHDDHVAEAALQNRGGLGQYQTGMIARVQELQRDVGDASATAEAEQLAASSLARDMILADPAYRRVLAEAVDALIGRFAPLFAYNRVVHDAAAAGIKLIPLPFTVLEDVRELRLWIASLYKLALLDDITQLPPELRPEPRPVVEVLP